MFKVFILLVVLSLADAKPVDSSDLSGAKSSNLIRPRPDRLGHFGIGASLTFYRGPNCDGQKSKFRCDGTCNTLPQVYNSLYVSVFKTNNNNNNNSLNLDHFR